MSQNIILQKILSSLNGEFGLEKIVNITPQEAKEYAEWCWRAELIKLLQLLIKHIPLARFFKAMFVNVSDSSDDISLYSCFYTTLLPYKEFLLKRDPDIFNSNLQIPWFDKKNFVVRKLKGANSANDNDDEDDDSAAPINIEECVDELKRDGKFEAMYSRFNNLFFLAEFFDVCMGRPIYLEAFCNTIRDVAADFKANPNVDIQLLFNSKFKPLLSIVDKSDLERAQSVVQTSIVENYDTIDASVGSVMTQIPDSWISGLQTKYTPDNAQIPKSGFSHGIRSMLKEIKENRFKPDQTSMKSFFNAVHSGGENQNTPCQDTSPLPF